MASRSISIALPDDAAVRLRELARREMRDPRAQAAYLVIAGLKAAGLDPEEPEANAEAPRHPAEPAR